MATQAWMTCLVLLVAFGTMMYQMSDSTDYTELFGLRFAASVVAVVASLLMINNNDKKGKDATGISSVRIVFGTTTGKSESTAASIKDQIQNAFPTLDDLDVVNMAEYDQDNLEQEDVIIFVVSTWSGGSPPETCNVFFDWLADMGSDFRVDKTAFLAKVRFSVIGLGSSDYDSNFCGAAKKLQSLLSDLGATALVKQIGMVDDSVEMDSQVSFYTSRIVDALGGKKAQKPKKKMQPIKKEAQTNEEPEQDEDRINNIMLEEQIGDMEDIVVVGAGSSNEMVTSSQRKALTKEGYKIIGTHSAVKLCRWTKHHLRGRGGCYKHTFYGITSYQCMEATPSLACANKCVFCWRHHKNPVGREWRWKMDDPEMIVNAAVEEHRGMMKQLKGMPGVQPERLIAADTVRHCALSLVGEPIMYPRINEMIDKLHDRKISTFLVTNAQFPDAILNLSPVTQLYVSVDAATKGALKEVDRPLFVDFWERFIGSLKSLKDKGQRTVYRLTLVKQWNMMQEELAEYAKLILLGEPDMIEIKAVTFCGKSDASNLTMENVPWHTEVRLFAEALCEATGGTYGCASEHVHSCCTLLARRDIYQTPTGKWRTWIDYDRFHELVQRFYSTGEGFESSDYLADTPDWALWGAVEEGFDPGETRFKRVRTKKADVVRPPAGLPRSAQ